MDVKTVHLNSDLNEEIFMNLPPSFHKPNIVWKLKRGLYSLTQAAHQWYKTIPTEFEKLGFICCHLDHSILYLTKDSTITIITIYVDDLLIILNSSATIAKIKSELSNHFEMILVKQSGFWEWRTF